jgi:hypothetical protein
VSEDGVTVDVAAPPEVVYDLLVDVTQMSRWSPEVVRCRWIRGASGPTPGAKFRGWSRKGRRRWSTVSTVVAADRPASFAFRVRFAGMAVATWHYTFDAAPSGTTVTERAVDQRGRFLRRTSPWITGSADRTARNDETIHVTLTRLRAAAEAAATR